MKRPQRLTCACCGEGTIGRQWWNRDTGYGVCQGCVDWQLGRGESPEDIRRNYGDKGVHYGLNTED